ncbi:MAG: RagB/SusD family nutrient uptake outer membrane protein, partial [Muribaculaceae bacterium]|nr:RagB/SusD family nutrient uptake outer membrane protein [Muribaculaceae bacterium]
AWEQCKSNTDNDSPSGIWEGHYLSIAGANAVLERLDEMQAAQGGELDETQKAIKGEALVLRSYSHFILAQVFCQAYAGPEKSKTLLGIPYVTAPEKIPMPHYDRGTLAETYEAIQKDLEEGLPLISNGLYEVPKYHFNTQAAHAYAARFYLFTRQYRKAVDEANLAFGGADVNPASYFSDIYTNNGSFYYISDFGKYNQAVDRPRNFMLIATYSTWFRRFTSGRRYCVIRKALNSTLQGPFPTVMRYTWGSTNGKGGKYYMHPAMNGNCGSNGQSEYGRYFAPNVSEQFETTDRVNNTGYCHVTRSEFTGEETALVRAEAYFFLGEIDKGFADLQTWENHRRNNTYGNRTGFQFDDFDKETVRTFYDPEKSRYADELAKYEIIKPINIERVCPSEDGALTEENLPFVQCVQHFRRIETVHTGMRWFDLKRYGLEFERKIGKSRVEFLSLDDPRRAMALPASVVAAGMQANPADRVTASEGLYKSKILSYQK